MLARPSLAGNTESMARENRAVSPSTSSTTSVRIASHIQLSPIVSDLKM